MMYLCLMLFTGLLLAVVGISIDYGKPTMISEIYYTAKERGWSLPCWSVPVLLVVMGMMCLPVMLNIGGFEFAAFLTCAGLMFVGAAPAYLDGDERIIHKTAAIVSAVASVVWGLSVMPLIVLTAAFAAAIAVVNDRRCWLLWCELCALASVMAIIVTKTLTT